MNLEELEEALNELLPVGYSITTDKRGQVVVLTNLEEDEDGELHTLYDEEEDPDFDPDFESLGDEEELED